MKYLTVLLVVGLIFVSAWNTKAISGLRGPSDQVVTLPEDGQARHLSIFVDDDWKSKPEQREFVAAFYSDSTYSSLRAQSHFHIYTPSDPIYQSRFKGAIDVFPCVLLQDETGKVEFKASGLTLYEKRPWLRVRPWLRPRPGPAPGPAPVPNVNVNVDTPIQPIPDTSSFPWPMLIVVMLVAAGVTFLVQFTRRSHT